MVMLTRSAHKKACESFSSSDVSRKNIIPPWCSSGKVHEKRKTNKVASPQWEMRSTYPLRENIWEYLYEDNVEQNYNCNNKKQRKRYKKTSPDNHSGKKTACLLVLFALGMGAIVSFWRESLEQDLTKLISLSFSDTSTAISEECCQKLKYMTDELVKAGHMLRTKNKGQLKLQRVSHITRRTDNRIILCDSSPRKIPNRYLCNKALNMIANELKNWHYYRSIHRSRATMLSTRTKTDPADTRYVTGVMATRGDNTKEWGGSITLWGLIPLWRVAPPPNVVLALRAPTLSDCWPFIGSYGEILIRLPKIQRISYVTIEHVQPDIARSAPKHFVLYGTLCNNTSIKVLTAQYRANGPAKQYYRIAYRKFAWKGLIFRVLSNQGNKKYTCIYRFHLYIENDSVIVSDIKYK